MSVPEAQSTELMASPGQRLSQERRKQGLNEREVADKLKITLSKLKALEQDKFDEFPAQIYLKGYLKNYARLLKVSEQEIHESYQAHFAQPITQDDQRPLFENEPPSSSKRNSYAFVVTAVLAVLVLFLFLQINQSNDTANAFEPAPSQSDPVLVEPEVLQDVSEGEAISVIAPIELEADERVVLVQEPIGVGALESATALANEVQEDTVEILASQLTAAELVSRLEPQVLEEPVLPTALVSVDVLDFRFANRCWVEVRDNAGSLLYSGLESAGSQLQIEGAAPFQVVIGEVAGTVLSYNGEAIPLQASADGRAIRLQVGS